MKEAESVDMGNGRGNGWRGVLRQGGEEPCLPSQGLDSFAIQRS